MKRILSLIAMTAMLVVAMVGLSPPTTRKQKESVTASVAHVSPIVATLPAANLTSAEYKITQTTYRYAAEVRPVARNGSYRDHSRTAYTYTYLPRAEVERDIGSVQL